MYLVSSLFLLIFHHQLCRIVNVSCSDSLVGEQLLPGEERLIAAPGCVFAIFLLDKDAIVALTYRCLPELVLDEPGIVPGIYAARLLLVGGSRRY